MFKNVHRNNFSTNFLDFIYKDARVIMVDIFLDYFMHYNWDESGISLYGIIKELTLMKQFSFAAKLSLCIFA
jgi:hypothetical protein